MRKRKSDDLSCTCNCYQCFYLYETDFDLWFVNKQKK